MSSRFESIYLLLRYFLVLILGISNLYLFYFIFTPLTVYPVLYILRLFGSSILLENTLILFNSIKLEIIQACIAGAAYYLLVILNLTTPLNLRKRIFSLIYLITTFLIINIMRIVLFSILYSNDFSLFDLAHQTTWYFGSTILVLLIWFSNVKIFSIDGIPAYTDLRYLLKSIKLKKDKKKNNFKKRIKSLRKVGKFK